MDYKNRKGFCTQCRKETEYVLRKQNYQKTIKDKAYLFNITMAICKECGEEISLPGLIDLNVKEIDSQYRRFEGIVSVADIEKLLNIYNIGKAPLSLALGFGEITISRYMEGQIPSKEYSDIIKRAIASPVYMQHLLNENRDKIADAAYRKASIAAMNLKKMFCVSEKMLSTISYIFSSLEEVTPLMLQKLLYFIQGVYSAINNRMMFTEECRAWVHGPVYVEVYNLFREFKYNPIEDPRFAILENSEKQLSESEKKAVDLVINTFGSYGAKVLEKITHYEKPWISARCGFEDDVISNEIITKKSIKDYYKSVNLKYDISTEKGLNNYIRDMIV